MLAQPQTYKCTLLIENIEFDPEVPGKNYFSGKILSVEEFC